jgi:recombination associated protein RdgC
MVKFTRHNLSTDEVKKHVQEGKMPQQLALNWEGKVDFLLTDTLQLKKIKPEEESSDKDTNQKQDAFDANIMLNTGVLGPMVIDLIEALGGEMPS